MNQKISHLFVFLLSVLVIAGCASGGGGDLLADIQERGVLRVSTGANNRPHSFLDENGEFVGFDVDVAREVAERLGVDVEFVTPAWDVVIAGNWGGQWDVNIYWLTNTTARQEVLDFVNPPYAYTSAQFVAADGSGIEALEDINGQVVCLVASTTYETWINGGGGELGLPEEHFLADPPAGVTLMPVTTDTECFQSIQAGQPEPAIVLTTNTIVQEVVADGVPVHPVGPPVFIEDLSAAFDRSGELDNASAVSRVGEIIQEMRADGTLSDLSIRWFGIDLSAIPTP